MTQSSQKVIPTRCLSRWVARRPNVFLCGCLGLAIQVMCAISAQALTVDVDRSIIAANETLDVQITTTSGGNLDALDLGTIEQDFDILSRSTQSTISMINGRTESRKSLRLKLSPLREGKLSIPALSLGTEHSRPQSILVKKARPAPSALDNRSVMLESEVNHHEALVGQQIIYTVRLLNAVPLANIEIESLNTSHVSLTPLADRSYQRDIDGVPYHVTEKRFALFVQRAGQLTIPAQQLTALVSERTNNFRFGFGFSLRGSDPFSRGKPITLATQPIHLTIEEAPQAFSRDYPNAAFLPATDIAIQQRWSDNLDSAVVGEPITRTVTILAQGLTAETLPDITAPTIDHANVYPEKPEYLNQEWSGGIAGERQQSIAIIPVQAGEMALPAIELPWWNIETQQLEVARLAGRRVTVAAAPTPQPGIGAVPPADHQHAIEPPLNQPNDNVSPNPLSALGETPTSDAGVKHHFWQIATIVLAIAWLLSTALLLVGRAKLRQQHRNTLDTPKGNTVDAGRLHSLRALQAACKKNDAAAAKQTANTWLASYRIPADASLIDTAKRLDDKALVTALAELDAALYSGDKVLGWRGDALLDACRNNNINKGNARANRDNDSFLPPLYPD